VGTWPVAQITRDLLVRSMVGRELTDIYPPRRATPAGEEVLSERGCAGPTCRGLVLRARREILGVGGMTGNGSTNFCRSLSVPTR